MQISMVDATLFENLEAVARHVRRSKAPFGGIQLILTGAIPCNYLLWPPSAPMLDLAYTWD